MTQDNRELRVRRSFRIDGSDLMDKAKQLVDEGNKHRVVVLNEDGKSVFDIPLTLAVVGGIIVFPATAVGVIAALATRHSIVVDGRDRGGRRRLGDRRVEHASRAEAATTTDAAPYGGPTVNPPLPPDSDSRAGQRRARLGRS